MSQAKLNAVRSVLPLVPEEGAIGLGSGSTIAIFAEELGKLVSENHIDIKVIPSSYQAYRLAIENQLPLTNFDLNPILAVTIDGADEVDKKLNLTKGGGGALFQEKIVASASDKLVIVVDESKLVDRLCTKHPIPIEVLPFAYGFVQRKLSELGITASVRKATKKLGPVVTDNGNFILDLTFPEPLENPTEWAVTLKLIPGVLETGIFAGMADEVHVGTPKTAYVLKQ